MEAAKPATKKILTFDEGDADTEEVVWDSVTLKHAKEVEELKSKMQKKAAGQEQLSEERGVDLVTQFSEALRYFAGVRLSQEQSVADQQAKGKAWDGCYCGGKIDCRSTEVP